MGGTSCRSWSSRGRPRQASQACQAVAACREDCRGACHVASVACRGACPLPWGLPRPAMESVVALPSRLPSQPCRGLPCQIRRVPNTTSCRGLPWLATGTVTEDVVYTPLRVTRHARWYKKHQHASLHTSTTQQRQQRQYIIRGSRAQDTLRWTTHSHEHLYVATRAAFHVCLMRTGKLISLLLLPEVYHLFNLFRVLLSRFSCPP